jgi:hypothetical protein
LIKLPDVSCFHGSLFTEKKRAGARKTAITKTVDGQRFHAEGESVLPVNGAKNRCHFYPQAVTLQKKGESLEWQKHLQRNPERPLVKGWRRRRRPSKGSALSLIVKGERGLFNRSWARLNISNSLRGLIAQRAVPGTRF